MNETIFNPEKAIQSDMKLKKTKRYKSATEDFREAHKLLTKVQGLFQKHPEGILVTDMIQMTEQLKSQIQTLVIL